MTYLSSIWAQNRFVKNRTIYLSTKEILYVKYIHLEIPPGLTPLDNFSKFLIKHLKKAKN